MICEYNAVLPLLGIVQALKRDAKTFEILPMPWNSNELFRSHKISAELLLGVRESLDEILFSQTWKTFEIYEKENPDKINHQNIFSYIYQDDLNRTTSNPWRLILPQNDKLVLNTFFNVPFFNDDGGNDDKINNTGIDNVVLTGNFNSCDNNDYDRIWQFDLFCKQLDMFIYPGVVNDKLTWTATVITCCYKINDNDNGNNDNDNINSDNNSHSKRSNSHTTTCTIESEILAVVDVIETDNNNPNDMAVIRHLNSGPWKGVNEFRETEIDCSKSPGQELISWYTTTLAGTCLYYTFSTLNQSMTTTTTKTTATSSSSLGLDINGVQEQQPPKCAVVGLGGGSLPSFLARYGDQELDITAIEISPEIAKAAELYFGLNVTLECSLLTDVERETSVIFTPGNEKEQLNGKNKFYNKRSNNHSKGKSHHRKTGTKDVDENGEVLGSNIENDTLKPVKVVVQDANLYFEGIASADENEIRFDCIILDVYTSEKFPSALLNHDFFSNLKASLKEKNNDAIMKHNNTSHVVCNAGTGKDEIQVMRLMHNLFPTIVVVTDADGVTEEDKVQEREDDREYENAVIIGFKQKQTLDTLMNDVNWSLLPELGNIPFKLDPIEKLNDYLGDYADFRFKVRWVPNKPSPIKYSPSQSVSKDDDAWELF
eukprot:Awhi_evm1s14226